MEDSAWILIVNHISGQPGLKLLLNGLFNIFGDGRLSVKYTSEFESEAEHVQEVFAHFGEAMYQAQCLEKEMAILLSCYYTQTPTEMSRRRADELFDGSLEQTFGALKNEIKRKIELLPETDVKLEEATVNRNWLAHHYWWDRVSELTVFSGRVKMLEELKELAALFFELSQVFSGMVKEWAFQHGLTQKDFDDSLADVLSGPTPPRIKRRKLNKTEMLVNVYSYIEESTTSLIFELDDNSFWSLCDCGFTYGPDGIDLSRLQLLPQFQKALPVKISPRPKGAQRWKYKFQFNGGYYFEVFPPDKNEKVTFKWRFYIPKAKTQTDQRR